MFIRSFEFEDLRTGWKLERTDLDRLNLLVGNSGVGKTKILRSLLEVAALTTIPSSARSSESPPRCGSPRTRSAPTSRPPTTRSRSSPICRPSRIDTASLSSP